MATAFIALARIRITGINWKIAKVGIFITSATTGIRITAIYNKLEIIIVVIAATAIAITAIITIKKVVFVKFLIRVAVTIFINIIKTPS